MNGKRSRAFRAFQKVKTLKPSRSLFDLSHEVLLSADMFKLYPVCAMEMSPGDTFHIANQSVTRLQPLNAPVMSRIEQCTHYFFVPYRILDDNWTEFITGGAEGENGGTVPNEPPETAPILPRWKPSAGKNAVGTLWDYFGLPVNVDPKGAYPLDYLRRAYNKIWNEYYRDENLQEEVPLDNEDILYRSWKKDYFTSALLSQQRGISPAMPVSGTAPIEKNKLTVSGTFLQNVDTIVYCRFPLPDGYTKDDATFPPITVRLGGVQGESSTTYTTITSSGSVVSIDDDGTNTFLRVAYQYSPITNYPYFSAVVSGIFADFITSSVDFESSGAGFDVKDLRQAFQIQKWLELANRGGVRYTEFLRAFFGVSPRDDRLQRPEYIGGSKSPIVISESYRLLQQKASRLLKVILLVTDSEQNGLILVHTVRKNMEYLLV